jgi:hypothetical protein
MTGYSYLTDLRSTVVDGPGAVDDGHVPKNRIIRSTAQAVLRLPDLDRAAVRHRKQALQGWLSRSSADSASLADAVQLRSRRIRLRAVVPLWKPAG